MDRTWRWAGFALGLILVVLSAEFVVYLLLVPHALAHGLAARLLGIPTAVHIGWGPELVNGVRKDGGGWRLGVFPGVMAVPDQAAFRKAPVWKRLAVLAAGPLVGFAAGCAMAWLFFALALHGPRTIDEPVVGHVREGSSAYASGLRTGDRVLTLAGGPIDDFHTLERSTPRLRTPIEVERGDAVVQLILSAGELSDLGVRHDRLGTTVGVEPGPAAEAGLQTGDRLTSVDGRPVSTWAELEAALSPGHHTLTGLRDLEAVTVELIVDDSTPLLSADSFVRTAIPGGPAHIAGVRSGDRLRTANGEAVPSFDALRTYLSRLERGDVVDLQVSRQGEVLTLPIEPTWTPVDRSSRTLRPVIGVETWPGLWAPGSTRQIPADAATTGRAATQQLVRGFGVARALVSGTLSPSALGGPLRVGAKVEAQPTVRTVFAFLAATALRATLLLTLWNLLPLPWSDTLQAADELLDALTGRRLPMWAVYALVPATVAALLLLVFVVDAVRYFA